METARRQSQVRLVLPSWTTLGVLAIIAGVLLFIFGCQSTGGSGGGGMFRDDTRTPEQLEADRKAGADAGGAAGGFIGSLFGPAGMLAGSAIGQAVGGGLALLGVGGVAYGARTSGRTAGADAGWKDRAEHQAAIDNAYDAGRSDERAAIDAARERAATRTDTTGGKPAA
jgi:hypothetical protein